uniref:Dynein light chain 1, cytoplasmic n=1 Tax=Chenopodium quinoa TaxID=63459 RepID=A0A803MM51_CHEQI
MSEEIKPPIETGKPAAEDRKPPLMGAGKRIIIKNADMADDMQKEALDIAIAAFEKVNVEKDVAESIKKEFDKKHGPTWHCIVGRNFGLDFDCRRRCNDILIIDESIPASANTPKPNKAHVTRRSPRNVKSAESKPPTTALPRTKLKPRKPIHPVCRRSLRFIKDSRKGEGVIGVKEKEEGVSGVKEKGKGVAGEVCEQGKVKEKRQSLRKSTKRMFKDEDFGSESGSSSSELSDLDIKWKTGEEDLEGSDGEKEQWHI